MNEHQAAEDQLKALLEKINLLFRIFDKDGLHKMSKLEQQLLKEQVQKLLEGIGELPNASTTNEPIKEEVKPSIRPIVSPKLEEPKVEEAPQTVKPVQEKETPKVEEPIPRAESNNEMSINERIAAQKDAAADENNNFRNMKEIIDLNKSFIFKKTLFNDDQQAYNGFIQQLNQTSDEIEAINIIEDYAEKYHWDKEDKVFDLIKRAAEKRFMPIL